jgi:hypothetical protein
MDFCPGAFVHALTAAPRRPSASFRVTLRAVRDRLPPPNTEYDAFLSYAHVDADLAVPIYNGLVSHGLSVFFDEHEIDDFTSIHRRITEGLARSKALIALYSGTYPSRRACQFELTSAFLAAQRVGDPRELFIAAVLYWAAWHFEIARLGRGLVHALVIGLVLAGVAFLLWRLGRHDPEDPDARRLAMRLIDSGYFPVLAAAVLTAFAANWAGAAEASRQEYFQVLRGQPSIVVLRQYDNRLIAARQVSPGIIERNVRFVLIVGAPGQREFERRKLGELRVASSAWSTTSGGPD